jgi:Glycosyltransferase family 87
MKATLARFEAPAAGVAARPLIEANAVATGCSQRQPLGLWDPLGAWPSASPWLWAGLALLVSMIMSPVYFGELSRRDDSMTDFFQDWASARNYLEGLPLYTDHNITIPRYLGKTNLDASDLFVEVNAHPPTSILMAIPFAALAYRQALHAWNLLSLGMLIVSLFLVKQGLCIPSSRWSIAPLLTLLLSCFPLLLQIHFGQTDLVLLLLLTGAWAADRSNRWILAGVLLGAAVTIKIFPAVVFLFFAVRGRWNTVAAGLVSIMLIILLTTVIFGTTCLLNYITIIIPHVAKYQGLWFNLSLPGYWTKLFDPPGEYRYIVPVINSPLLARAGTLLTCIPVLAALIWAVRRARTLAESDLSFGLTLTAMLLVSPITWDHYLLLMLLPLATTWVHLPRSPGPRALFVGIAIAFWSWPYKVFDCTIPGGITGTAKPLHTITVGSYQCYALVAFFVLGIIELRKLELVPLPRHFSSDS